MNAHDFLQQLQATTRRLQALLDTELRPLSDAALNRKPGPAAWSAFECLEHLNRYSRYYQPVLHRALSQANRPTAGEVGYSWLGRKSLDIVRPDNGKQHQTVKHMNPAGSQLNRTVLDEFSRHLDDLQTLLAAAAAVDLNRKTVPVEFFRLLKLRTGETLEFVVLHAERHLGQAVRAACPAPHTTPILSV